MKNKASLIATMLFIGISGCSPDDSETGQDLSNQVAPPATHRPNILFIVADDIGFTDIGAFGSEISTPNLDKLAYGGLRLNNLHAAPACRDMRLMLMSSAGTSAANHPMPGAFRNGVLSLNYATIPELLQDAGYATYAAGKWDLGEIEGYTPGARGFDRYFTALAGAASYFAEPLFPDVPAYRYEEDGRTVELTELPNDFYATEYFTDKMLGYLRSTEEDSPWFAYMPYTAPHWPLQLPEDWLDRYAGRYDAGYDELRERRFEQAAAARVLPPGASLEGFEPLAEPWANLSPDEQRRYSRAQEIYAGMIEYLDMSIGRVINYLEESKQLNNTVIVFTADHGASSGEHGVDTGRLKVPGGGPETPDGTDNSLENFGRPGSFIDHGRGFGEAATAPFKFQKSSLSEGGLRAAAFVHYPAAVAAGDVSNAFMTMMDILPTFMEVAGTEHPGAGLFNGRQVNDIAGRSAWPHLTGNASTVHTPTESAGWSGGSGGALIRGDYKIIDQPSPGGGMGTMPWRLYNLAVDPGETRDLAMENPELVTELVAEWEANWR